MRSYITRRFLVAIPTLLLASLIIFLLIKLIPGDIIDAMQQIPDIQLDRAQIEHELGLDAPLLVQYGRWMGFVPQMDGSVSGILQGNLGTSFVQARAVVELVAIAWPVTFELGIMAFILILLIALPIGVYSALRQDKWGDYIGRSFAILALAIPGFWIGTMVMVFPALWWNWSPPIMVINLTEDPMGNLKMFIVPAIVLALGHAGINVRIIRTQMLEVMREDYIRTAWAKGLRERVVVIRHTLKNALIPIVSSIGLQVPVLLGGTVVIEQIFCLAGMGRLLIGGLLGRDEELVRGVVFIFALALLIVNLLVDLTYAYLDPRVHYK